MNRRRELSRKFVPGPPCFGPHRTVKPVEPWFRGTKHWRRTTMPRIGIRTFAFALATLPFSAGLSAATAKPAVEVAFVLDTTGSMGGLIEGAKRKIWSIATAIVDSNPDA